MNERKKSSVSFWHSMKTSFMLVVVAVAAAIYGIYRFFTPDYLDDFEDDFEDEFDNDFFEDEDDEPAAESKDASADKTED